MKRRIINLAAIVIIAALTISFMLYVPSVIKNRLIGYAKSKYDVDLKISFVSFAFPVGVSFHDVGVTYKNCSFSSKRVGLYFDIVKLMKKHAVLEALKKVSLTEPELTAPAPADLQSLALPVSGNGPGTPGDLVIDWRNAKVKFSNDGRELDFEYGKVALSDEVQSFESSLFISDIGKIKGKLIADKKNKFWDAKVYGKGLSFEGFKAINKITKNNDIPGFDVNFYAKGSFSDHDISGKLNFIIDTPDVKKGKIRMESQGSLEINTDLKQAKAKLETLKLIAEKNNYSGGAEFSYTNGVFSVNGLTLSEGAQKLTLKGDIGEGRVSVNANLSGIDVENIYAGAKGKINSNITVRGNITNPVVILRADTAGLELMKSSVKIGKSRISMDYQDKTLKLNGTANYDGFDYVFYVSAKNRLAEISSDTNDDNSGSEFYGNAGITGPNNSLKGDFLLAHSMVEISNCRIIDKSGRDSALLSFKSGVVKNTERNYTLSARVKDFQYGSKKISCNLTSSGNLDTKESVFSGDVKIDGLRVNKFMIGNVRCRAEYGKNKISIDDFQADNYIFASFGYDTEDNKLYGSGALKNFNLLRLGVSGLEGEFDSQFTMLGTLSSPEIFFKYGTNRALYKKAVIELQGKGNVNTDRLIARGSVEAAGESGEYDVTANLKSGDSTALNAKVKFPKLRAETINTLFGDSIGFKIPIKGVLNSSFEISGSLDNPEILIKANSSNMVYSGNLLPEKWDSFDIAGRIIQKPRDIVSIELEKLNIGTNEQQISITTGSVVDITPTGEKFNANLRLKDYDFGIGTMYGGLRIYGDVSAGTSTGNSQNVILNSVVDIQNLWINQQNIKDTSVGVKYTSGARKSTIEIVPSKCRNCNVTGTVDISENNINLSNISVQSSNGGKKANSFIRLNGSYSKANMNIMAEGSNMQLDYISKIANLKLPLEGATDFSVVMRGDTKKPYLTGTLNVSAGSVYMIPFTNANVHFNFNGSVLNVINARIVKLQDSREILALTGNGSVPFTVKKDAKSSSEDISLNFQLDGDLSILEAMIDDVKSAKGTIGAKIKISGNIKQPYYGGYVVLTEGNIRSKRYFDNLEKLNVAVSFSENKLEIKECSGKLGQGRFKAEGSLMLVGLFDIDEYNVSIKTTGEKGVKLSVPDLPIPKSTLLKPTGIEDLIKEYSSGEPRFDLSLNGKSDDLKLSGYIQLDNTHFCYPPPEKLVSPGGGVMNDFLKNVSFNLEFRAGENTWYENELVSANIYGSLKLSGKNPEIVNGKIESSRGKIEYLGKIYDVKEALFEVINNDCWLEAKAETSAVFSAQANSTSKELGTVTMTLPRSPITDINPRFSSADYPEMGSDELVRRTFGFSENMTQNDRSLMLRQSVVRLFDAALTSTFAKGIIRKIGFDYGTITSEISNDPASDASNNTAGQPGAAPLKSSDLLKNQTFEFTKILGRDFLLNYALNLGEKLDIKHEFELVYRWKGNIWVHSMYTYKPSETSNRDDWQLLVEPRWRFGWDDKKEKKK